jgi:ABC-2 type transport system ATP-binding protein
MMGALLKAKDLRKNYFNKKVLDGLDLELHEGKILGLLGPNNSGKTTFMKIAATLTKPSSGIILINEKRPGVDTKAIVSYLPDVNQLYSWMTVKDAVDFFKSFYLDFDIEKVNEMLELMKLDKGDKVRALSKGSLEKLNIALILSRKAKLYLLDEPLNGVDANSREEIIDAILENYSVDSSVIISTHLIREVERMFDEVAIMSKGKIILHENAEELRREKGKSIEVLYKGVIDNV